ncbi:MAG: SIR2 family protein [Candidatus Nitrosopolaris sp.]
MAITQGDEQVPKHLLSNELRKIKPPDFKDRNTPPSVLADLNLPIYITTNYDHFIEEALKTRRKEPISDFCRWSEVLVWCAKENEINPLHTTYRPTQAKPLVYHLYGDVDYPHSLVLTALEIHNFWLLLLLNPCLVIRCSLSATVLRIQIFVSCYIFLRKQRTVV